jgi:plasmid stabilization system protein ParE
MSYQLIVEPEADSEIHAAFQWYEDKQQGLGLSFLAELDSTLVSISQSPDSRATVFADARLALVKRFPYVVCYLIEDKILYVVAVFHGHRDSSSWKQRLD